MAKIFFRTGPVIAATCSILFLLMMVHLILLPPTTAPWLVEEPNEGLPEDNERRKLEGELETILDKLKELERWRHEKEEEEKKKTEEMVEKAGIHEEQQGEDMEDMLKAMEEEDKMETAGDNHCTEAVKKVAFAKTHKTGSSTLQNIFLRFGVKHDLTFAFPANSWMFNLSIPFNASLVLDGPFHNLGFDLFVSHCNWRKAEVAKVIPKAKFVTILRDPVDCFESNFMFMGAAKNLNLTINEYAEKHAATNAKRKKNAYVGRNQLLWDMGMDIDDMDDELKVRDRIRQVEREFDQVLITEQFDESLVLMADLLCWPMRDVTYLNQMERLSRSIITAESRAILKTWLWADYLLYDHFVSLHRRRVSEFGAEKMSAAVEELSVANAAISADCIAKKANKTELSGPGSGGIKTVYGYQVAAGKSWCWPYARRETEFAKQIRNYQYQKVKYLDQLRGVNATE